MRWVKISELPQENLVADFDDLIDVMLSDRLTEFQLIVEKDTWIPVKK